MKIYVDKETGQKKGDALVTYLKVVNFTYLETSKVFFVSEAPKFCILFLSVCALGTFSRLGFTNFGRDTIKAG